MPNPSGFIPNIQARSQRLVQSIGECDPHLWQNVTNVIVYTLNIRNAFIAADPVNADTYNTNAGNYIAQLQKLDADVFATVLAMRYGNFRVE